MKRAALLTRQSRGPKLSSDFAKEAANFVDLRQIGLEDGRSAAFARNGFGFGAGGVEVNRYVKTALRKLNCDDAADAFGCTRDQYARH